MARFSSSGQVPVPAGNVFSPLVLASLCLVSAQAFAQWQWVGSDGRKAFSDRPPPADVRHR
ncbi:hypothetical protein CCO03_05545 [Comamonas serinivorans]|uniref:DUF4124 domain-containing protein n=1 Tax=Comamonas serinivorans TaxID=1082851 RepID=A0A1Y0EL87_9BURK|nr:DUF4124 domain-containing protein [Comamonas serinivorans]ARU04211.1 hypothetical protein CCO03_05545 [Comamonas serinivorans]